MIVRVSIANIDAKGLAQRLQAAGLDGTAWDHVGTARWGVEAGATFETVVNGIFPERAGQTETRSTLTYFIIATLRNLREEAAYITVDGRLAFLLYAGEWSEYAANASRVYHEVPVRVESL